MRTDVDGKQLNEGDVVENWEGRRAVLDVDFSAKDEMGELKTPIKFIGKQTEKDPISLKKHIKPSWHPLNRWLEQR